MRVGLLVAGLLVAGCAHRSPFPSAAKLKELAQKPRPAKPFGEAAVNVPRFELEGPFEPGPHETKTPWGALFAAVAKGRFEADGALGCAARELARFGLEHRGRSSTAVHAFVLGRCGAVANAIGLSSLSGEAPDGLSDAQLFAQWQPDLKKLLDFVEPGDRAGLALVRRGGKVWVTVVRQRLTARLTTVPRFPDADGKIVVEGALDYEAAKAEAMINRGALGFADCVRDEQVALPRFRFTCTPAKDDPQAWLTVVGWKPGRLLGFEAARVLVWPTRQPSSTWVQPAHGQPGAPTAEVFVERLNGVRKGAGLPELTLVPAQSATATSLAPHYFGGGDDEEQRDQIALGMMAGWDVEGLISEGTFYSDWTPAADASVLLSQMLDAPSGRRDLLAPKATRISAGVIEGESSMGMLVSTYTLLADLDPREAPKQLIVALNEARQKVGQGPVQWMFNPTDFYERAPKLLLSNAWDPEDAGEVFMNETVQITNRPVRGNWLYLSKLDEIPWPKELLEHPAPQVLVFVAIYKDPRDAWAHYVLLVVTLGGSAGTTA